MMMVLEYHVKCLFKGLLIGKFAPTLMVLDKDARIIYLIVPGYITVKVSALNNALFNLENYSA